MAIIHLITVCSSSTSLLTTEFLKNPEQEFSCYQLQETFGFLDLSFNISNMHSSLQMQRQTRFPHSYSSHSSRGNPDKNKPINKLLQID